jgi:hypothetical protein
MGDNVIFSGVNLYVNLNFHPAQSNQTRTTCPVVQILFPESSADTHVNHCGLRQDTLHRGHAPPLISS